MHTFRRWALVAIVGLSVAYPGCMFKKVVEYKDHGKKHHEMRMEGHPGDHHQPGGQHDHGDHQEDMGPH